MCSKITQVTRPFRDSFNVNAKEIANWFPGHMAKGMRQMQNKLRSVDCIIEVHDARIPISGRNPMLYQTLTAVKPRLLVLNKVDTVTSSDYGWLTNCLQEKMGDGSIIYTNCKKLNDDGVAQVLPTALKLINLSKRYNRDQSLTEFLIMIIGVPNVGKSSLINRLRHLHLNKGRATHVGATPGVTRSVLERIKIFEKPSVYLVDTPGIMQPNVTNTDMAFKLALCGIVDAHIFGMTRVADYLLYWLNKMQNFSYVDQFLLNEPSDDINEVLLHLAIKFEKYNTLRTSEGSRTRHPDFDATALMFIQYFRDGKFGRIMLDDDMLNNMPTIK